MRTHTVALSYCVFSYQVKSGQLYRHSPPPSVNVVNLLHSIIYRYMNHMCQEIFFNFQITADSKIQFQPNTPRAYTADMPSARTGLEMQQQKIRYRPTDRHNDRYRYLTSGSNLEVGEMGCGAHRSPLEQRG